MDLYICIDKYIYMCVCVCMSVRERERERVPGLFNKEFAKGSTVYRCTIFKEINIDASSHVPEHWQGDLLYKLLCSELFLYRRVSVFRLHGLSFLHRLEEENPCLAYLRTCFSFSFSFYENMLFRAYRIFFWKKFTLFLLPSHNKSDDRHLEQ